MRTKPKRTRDGISQNFPLLPKFLYHSRTRRRGHFSWAVPQQPRPLLARPRPLSSSPACPGSTSRSRSLELFLPKVLTGCSRCPLGFYTEKIWQGLPSQQSPICSERTERQPLSEGGVRYIRSQTAWLPSKALAPDFQTNTHLLKDEPRRNCEEGLRCGDLGVRR